MKRVFHAITAIPVILFTAVVLYLSLTDTFDYTYLTVVSSWKLVAVVVLCIFIVAVCILCVITSVRLAQGFFTALFINCGALLFVGAMYLLIAFTFSGATASITNDISHWGKFDDYVENHILCYETYDLFPDSAENATAYHYRYERISAFDSLYISATQMLNDEDFSALKEQVTQQAQNSEENKDGDIICTFNSMTIMFEAATHNVHYQIKH